MDALDENAVSGVLVKHQIMTLRKHIIVTESEWAYLSRVSVAKSSHSVWLQTRNSERLPYTAEE